MTAPTTCTFYSYNTRNSCHAEATEATAASEWDAVKKESIRIFQPRCKRHASVEANKTYGARERFLITDDIRAQWAADKAKADKAAAIRKAETAERNRKAAEAQTARMHAEAEVEYEHLRQDGEESDWSSYPPTQVSVPRWIVRPIGATEPYRETCEVSIKREPGRPDQVVVRSSSHLTPKEALHLAEAIKAAYGETK